MPVFAIKVKTKKTIESVNTPELALILLVASRDPGAARSLRVPVQGFECEHCYRGNPEAARSLTAREFESRQGI
jgi:hypothetical protein